MVSVKRNHEIKTREEKRKKKHKEIILANGVKWNNVVDRRVRGSRVWWDVFPYYTARVYSSSCVTENGTTLETRKEKDIKALARLTLSLSRFKWYKEKKSYPRATRAFFLLDNLYRCSKVQYW